MSKIKAIRARQLLDCKCRPMVEAEVETESGAIGTGSAPTGSSVGSHESFVLRDNDKGEYGGLSVHLAVNNVIEKIAPALIGMDVEDLRKIDERMIELDGSFDKHNLGGNAIYSVSIAALRAAAADNNMPVYRYILGRDPHTVPVPTFNVINGGKYGDLIQPFNEFLIVPWKANSIYEAVEMGVKVFSALEQEIPKVTGISPMVGRSYGWVAPSENPDDILNLLSHTVKVCGYEGRIAFAMDCASGEMYNKEDHTYYLFGNRVSSAELVDFTAGLSRKYPLFFIEDLLDEDDFDGFKLAHEKITNSLIIGDDLIASDRARLEKAHAMNAVDGFILKPNQIGTITEAKDTHDYAVNEGLLSITSGRSGGVVDDIVMDLAVGYEIGFIKNGAPRSGERISKLNFLMRACDLAQGCTLADLSKVARTNS
ncbi:MAG: enolase [Lachnospiraceae bacterium]|jgi:enolase|nr:enolase [Lachnospiraceae bacterium]